MAKSDVVKFKQALADSDGRDGPKSVLLGNGFSIGWKRAVFHYESLFDEAELGDLSVSKEELFEALATTDFETVIEHLNSAADLADLYEASDPELSETLRWDANVVKNGLADVLALRHPNRAQDVTDTEAEQARAFLSNFLQIFTVNYDLLLYWVVNRSAGSAHIVSATDGFEWPTYQGPHELIWKSRPTQGTQRIFYLHGALHYFREPDRKLHKLKYGLADPLIDQIRERITSGHYPRLVTEGKSEQKMASIEASAYLRRCRRKLSELSGSLFIHGMSLSSNDSHIVEVLEAQESKVAALYVSVHGDPDSNANEDFMSRARRIKRRRERNNGRKLHLVFYDTASAHVWR